MESEPSANEEASSSAIQRKPKTEIRKPKKNKKVEDVDPIVLRKRMRQLYKAVVNYQVIIYYALVFQIILLSVVYSFYQVSYFKILRYYSRGKKQGSRLTFQLSSLVASERFDFTSENKFSLARLFFA